MTRNHHPDCPAYSTKGRELADMPCGCGARESIDSAKPEQVCPDCLRPFAETAHQQAHDEWCMYQHSDGCSRRTIAHLRADLAARQALTEAERAVVDAALAWVDGGTVDYPLEVAIRRLQKRRAKEHT